MTTTEICKLTGLSMDRVQQFAKSEGIKKTGRDYHFTEEQYELFKSRIGRRGRPAKEISVCPECKGNKFKWDGTLSSQEPCPTCNGTGTKPEPIEPVCPDCSGTMIGSIYNIYKCLKCGREISNE